MNLLASSFLTASLSIGFIIVCVLMMLVILIQRPKGGGLSGAFGGGGGSAQAAFGAKTGDVLTWLTVGFFVVFLFLAMGLTWSIRSDVDAAQQSVQPVGITDPDAATDDVSEGLEGAAEEATETIEETADAVEEAGDAVIEEVEAVAEEVSDVAAQETAPVENSQE